MKQKSPNVPKKRSCYLVSEGAQCLDEEFLEDAPYFNSAASSLAQSSPQLSQTIPPNNQIGCLNPKMRPPIPLPNHSPKLKVSGKIKKSKKNKPVIFPSSIKNNDNGNNDSNKNSNKNKKKKKNHKKLSLVSQFMKKNIENKEITEDDIVNLIIKNDCLSCLPIEASDKMLPVMQQAAAHQNVHNMIHNQQSNLMMNISLSHKMIDTSNSSDDETDGSANRYPPQSVHHNSKNKNNNINNQNNSNNNNNNSGSDVYRMRTRDNSLVMMNAVLSIEDIPRFNSSESSSDDDGDGYGYNYGYNNNYSGAEAKNGGCGIDSNVFYVDSREAEVSDVDELLAFEIIEPFKFDLLDYGDPVSRKINVVLRPAESK